MLSSSSCLLLDAGFAVRRVLRGDIVARKFIHADKKKVLVWSEESGNRKPII